MSLAKRPRIIVFSGAGLSADSGIPTYRGTGGLYNGMKPEEVMSGKAFHKNPQYVHRFCDDRRVALSQALPNAAHHALVQLATTYGDRFVHFTQNIDDLVERAGYHGSHHLHGELRVLRSIGNARREVDIGHRRYWDGSLDVCPAAGFRFKCPDTGTLFRPHVVLFGEIAPLYLLLRRTLGDVGRDDLLIVIGTQGGVVRIDDLVWALPCKKVLNNLHDSDHIDHRNYDHYLKMPAADASFRILEIVSTHLGHKV